MRVIGGEFRSRRLKTPNGDNVRPTPDRLREALFNVLTPRIEGVTFLDAYAGCGSVGIEALSRLEENILALNIGARSEVHAGNAAPVITKFPADVVFLDPPYPREYEY